MKRLTFATMAVAFVVLFAFTGKAWALEPKEYPNMSICEQPHKVIVDQKGTCYVEELSGKKRIFVREDRAQEVRNIFKSQKVRKQIIVCPQPKDVKIPQASKKSSTPKKSAVPAKPIKPAKVKSEASKSGQQYCPPAKPATPIAPPKAMGQDEGRRYCPPAKTDDFNRQRVQAKAPPNTAPPAGTQKPALGRAEVGKPVEDKMPADSDVRRYAYSTRTTDADGKPIIKKVTITHQSWTNLQSKEVKRGFVWIPGQIMPPEWMQEVGGKMNGIDPETGNIREMEIPMAMAINYSDRGSAVGIVGKYSKMPDDRHLLKQISYEERKS